MVGGGGPAWPAIWTRWCRRFAGLPEIQEYHRLRLDLLRFMLAPLQGDFHHLPVLAAWIWQRLDPFGLVSSREGGDPCTKNWMEFFE